MVQSQEDSSPTMESQPPVIEPIEPPKSPSSIPKPVQPSPKLLAQPLEESSIEPTANLGALGFLNRFKNNLVNKVLEYSNQADPEPELYQLIEIASYGFPGVPTCMSYDPVQKLLAVGTNSGRLVILGGSGIALRLMIDSTAELKFIKFLSNLPLVVLVTSSYKVFVLDIINLTINLIYTSLDPISSLEHYLDTNHLLLGTDLGRIKILDVVFGIISDYSLINMPGKIESMLIHPNQCHLLLVGLSNGEIQLVNLKTNKVLVHYDINKLYTLDHAIHLTALCWCPSGDDRLVAGYSNGWIIFFDMNQPEPIWTRSAGNDAIDVALELAVPEPRAGITGLNWCLDSTTQQHTIYVSGGEDIETPPVLRIIKLGDANELNSMVNDQVISYPTPILEIHVLPTHSPWSGGLVDPLGLLVLTEGKLHYLSSTGDELNLHVLLDWLNLDIVSTKLISGCSPHLHNAVLAHNATIQSLLGQPTPHLEGGVHLPRQVDHYFYDLMITLHSNGSIRLWDSSSNILTPLTHLTLSTSTKPLMTDLDRSLGILAVGYDDGKLMGYRVCLEPKCSRHSSNSTSISSSKEVSPPSDHIQLDTNTNASDLIPEENDDRTDIYVNLIQSPYQNQAINPCFEIKGHHGNLTFVKAHTDILVAGDDQGGLSITDTKRNHTIYYERDVSLLPVSYTDKFRDSLQVKINDLEYPRKADLASSNGLIRLLVASNHGIVYMYRMDFDTDEVIRVSKGKVLVETIFKEDVLNVHLLDLPTSPKLTTPTTPTSPKLPNGEADSLTHLEDSDKRSRASSQSSLGNKFTMAGMRGLDKIGSKLMNKKSASKSSLNSEIVTPEVKDKMNEEVESLDPIVASPELKSNRPTFDDSSRKSSYSNFITNPIKTLSNNSIPKLNSINKELILDTEVTIVCTESRVLVISNKTKKVLKDKHLLESRGILCESKPVFMDGKMSLIILTNKGYCDVYSLPDLVLMKKSQLNITKDAKQDNCTITLDGRIVVGIDDNELKQFCLAESHPAMRSPLCSKIQLYDPTRICPETPVQVVPWYKVPFQNNTSENIVRLFERSRPITKKPLDRTQSNLGTRIRTFDRHDTIRAKPSNASLENNQPLHQTESEMRTELLGPNANLPEPAKTGISLMLQQATDKLKERNDKLNEISDNTAQTKEASEDFLSEIKAFNKRQKEKKWYQL